MLYYFFIGMPFEYSLLVSMGIAGLQVAADIETDKKEIKRSNGLSFILDMQNRLKKRSGVKGRF